MLSRKHVGYLTVASAAAYAVWGGWTYWGLVWLPTLVGIWMINY